jgi:hypothetical protein
MNPPSSFVYIDWLRPELDHMTISSLGEPKKEVEGLKCFDLNVLGGGNVGESALVISCLVELDVAECWRLVGLAFFVGPDASEEELSS